MRKNPHESANFLDQKDLILAKVAEHGDITDMNAWRTAFPDIEFYHADRTFSGREIDWDSYSPTEKAAYVAYMINPEQVFLSFELSHSEFDIDDLDILQDVDGGKALWACWFFHVFAYFEDGGYLTRDAIQILLHYIAQEDGDFQDADLSGVEIELPNFSHQRVI